MSNSSVNKSFPTSLNDFADACHKASHNWWYDADGTKKERNKGELIALMHSELSEALEGIRKDSMDDHLPDYTSEAVELVDTLIRIFDYAGAHDIDLDEVFWEKMQYNAQRADHKPENRAKEGGKKF